MKGDMYMNTEKEMECLSNENPCFDDPVQWYIHQAKKEKQLTKEEEQQLVRAAQKGDRQARDRLVRSNLLLVVQAAMARMKSRRIRNLHVLDLIQEGNIGLMKAVEKFDPDRGTRFSTYATSWIKQAIGREIDRHERVIAIPGYLCDQLKKAYRLRNEEEQGNCSSEDFWDSCRKAGMKEDAIPFVSQADNVISFSVPVGEDDSCTMEDNIADEATDSPEISLLKKTDRRELRRRFSLLDPLEKKILSLSYGLFDEAAPKVWNIAHQLGMTQKNVIRIRQEALQKLRQPACREDLEDLPLGA